MSQGDAPPPADGPHDVNEGPRSRCDYCRLPIPGTPLVTQVGSEEYVFCSRACREELLEGEGTGTIHHGFHRTRLGVGPLDRDLPEGMPRNAFVLLSGEAGTRTDALGIELVWRTLERGEPAAVVSFTEPPIAVVQRFLDLAWNVFPALEDGRLQIIDCFTGRLDRSDRVDRGAHPWNAFLARVTKPRTVTVDDPSDPAEIRNRIDRVAKGFAVPEGGLVYLDSLTEFGALVQPIRAYDFVKDVRATIPKGRFVPLVAGATPTTPEAEGFPHDLAYVIDGLVELRMAGDIVEDTLIRRVRVRKMNGVPTFAEWTAFEFTRGRGMVGFDPHQEMAPGPPPGGPSQDGHS